MIVCPAKLSDVDTLLDWRRELAAWLASIGEDQWQIPWPRWAVAGAVQTGQTWMVWDGETPVASINLTTDFDSVWKSDKGPGLNPDALWLPDDDPGNSLFVSKLMVPRVYAGDGLGAELLDWAAGRAYDAELLWLRLDAWTTNTRLHDWYRRLGFTHVRTVSSRPSGACFQRPSAPYHGRLKSQS